MNFLHVYGAFIFADNQPLPNAKFIIIKLLSILSVKWLNGGTSVLAWPIKMLRRRFQIVILYYKPSYLKFLLFVIVISFLGFARVSCKFIEVLHDYEHYIVFGC